MNQSAAEFLISDAGEPILAQAIALRGDKATRVLAMRKNKAITPDIAALAVEVAVARERAKRRGFADAEKLFVTDDALAQATSPRIAAYHARYLAPFSTVADLCCGIGMDALALAEGGARVIAVDTDPVRLTFARANAAVRGVSDRITFLCEPVESLGWIAADAAFFDPARRTDAGRVSRHGDKYAPPLDFLHTIREHVRGGCAKLSPALPDDVLLELEPSRVEFLSEHRECKEACVWFGETVGASGAGEAMRAVFVDAVSPLLAGGVLPPSARRREVQYLLDPDPAILRSYELDTLGDLAHIERWSEGDSYLSSDHLLPEALQRAASAYKVIADMPYQPKKVRAWLRENGYSRIVVKKRFFAGEPEAIAKELGVAVRGDGAEITLVLIREDNKRFTAVFCEPVQQV